MNDDLEQLKELLEQTFENGLPDIHRETTPENIEGWDSLICMDLMVRIEKKFGFQFTSSEIASFKTVGELLDAINQHIVSR